MTKEGKCTKKIIYPGSYNPLTWGHLAIANYAEKKYGSEVTFEICEKPYDKEPLSEEEKQKRKGQFDLLGRDVVFTDCSSFVQKAIYFRRTSSEYVNNKIDGTVFLVGSDTLSRIQDIKYYFYSEVEMKRCLEKIRKCYASFLAFPRPDKISLIPELEKLVEWADLPPMDISSTQFRSNKNYLEEKWGPFGPEINIEHVKFGSIVLVDGDIGKVLPTSQITKLENNKSQNLIKCVIVQKNEEFFEIPFGTKVRVKLRSAD